MTAQTIESHLTTIIKDRQNQFSAEEIAKAVLAEYTLIPKNQAPVDQVPDPLPGQLWRNRQSGRVVRIVHKDELASGSVHWEVADQSRGPKTGKVYTHYWDSRFDYVAEES